MTIFRCKCFAMLALATACSPGTSTPSELDRIKRITNIEEAGSQLQSFAEERQQQAEELRRELTAAGFRHSTSPDENDPGCEFYQWANDGEREPVVLTVNICNGQVSTGAGVPNP